MKWLVIFTLIALLLAGASGAQVGTIHRSARRRRSALREATSCSKCLKGFRQMDRLSGYHPTRAKFAGSATSQ